MYEIQYPDLPLWEICGFCHKQRRVEATIHFKNVASPRFPKGVWVDTCKECLDEQYPYLDQIGLLDQNL